MLLPPPITSAYVLRRIPRSAAIATDGVESFEWYESMPSMSRGVRPASRIARRTASTPSARVDRPEARLYSVSPTPTMQGRVRRWRTSVSLAFDRGPHRPNSSKAWTRRARASALGEPSARSVAR